jgi:N-acetylmuramic acid 6-phosphate etherase
MAPSDHAGELEGLITESRLGGHDYAEQSTRELVALMNAEDAQVPVAVSRSDEAIADAIDAIAERLAGGGRLVYAGAGSSGAIGALDAGECEATFSTDPGQVVALVAGAQLGSMVERDAAEDDPGAGRTAVERLGISASDVLVGISASGRTPWVLGALGAADDAGALTVALVSVPDSELARRADHEIAVVVGPEIVAGSTRLKAGTAQKLVLNMISTITMIRLGKTHGDLMVDVRASNEKLQARARRIVSVAAGVSDDEAEEALARAGGSAKVALVSLLAGVDPEAARARLERAGGHVTAALEP